MYYLFLLVSDFRDTSHEFFDELYTGHIILKLKPVGFPSTEVYVLWECGIHACEQAQAKFACYNHATDKNFVLKYDHCYCDLVFSCLLQTCYEHNTVHKCGRSICLP